MVKSFGRRDALFASWPRIAVFVAAVVGFGAVGFAKISRNLTERKGLLKKLTGAKARAERAGESRLDVLVVDDLDMNRDLVKLLLENVGHSVTTAHDGAEAIERSKAKPYDLILMDIEMPGMDGVEATRHIRKLDSHNQSVPIVALTSNVMAEQVMSYTRAGFTDHIGKPIVFEQFLGRMERWAKRLERGEQERVADDRERMAG